MNTMRKRARSISLALIWMSIASGAAPQGPSSGQRSVLVSAVIASAQERAILPAASQQSHAKTQAAPVRAEVLVLGSYHMANPGHDIFNTQADDVLAPRRQAEMTQLIEVLKKFHPPDIAIESDVFGERPKQYADYLAGKRELTRNEIEQIGFRLAKELGHKTVYPVDADGEFPCQRLVNYAKASGRSKELEEIMAGFGAKVKAQDQYLASHSILETLLNISDDDKVAEEGRLYYQMAHFNEPGDWAGADLLSDWFRRNMRIFGNVVRLIDSPALRIRQLDLQRSGGIGTEIEVL